MNDLAAGFTPPAHPHPWRDWTADEWSNAVYCEDCGLPLLEIPNEKGDAGSYQCVYCTWLEDHLVQANSIKTEIVLAKDDATRMQALIILQHNLLSLYARRIEAQSNAMIIQQNFIDEIVNSRHAYNSNRKSGA